MTDSGEDALGAIQSSLANYWAIELQKIVIAAISGMNKDNGGSDSGDFAHDVVGTSFTDNVTNFTIANLVDSAQTLGDHKFGLSILVVHSVVASKMEKLEYVTVGVRPSAGAQLATWGRYTVLITDMIPSGTSAVRADGSAAAATMYESPGCSRLAPFGSELPRRPTLPRRGSGQLAAVWKRRRPNRPCAESGVHDCRSVEWITAAQFRKVAPRTPRPRTT